MWKLTAALILAIALVACGDDGTGPTTPTTTTTTTTTPTTTSSNDLGACTVGMTVRPGQSCTYAGGTFSVRDDGFGCVGGSICSGNSVTINAFRASKISGSNDWRIDTL